MRQPQHGFSEEAPEVLSSAWGGPRDAKTLRHGAREAKEDERGEEQEGTQISSTRGGEKEKRELKESKTTQDLVTKAPELSV